MAQSSTISQSILKPFFQTNLLYKFFLNKNNKTSEFEEVDVFFFLNYLRDHS